MIADKLRKSILQQAIQGKLFEQLPTDGNASDLLADIRAEKNKLIADGKIKKEKPLPPISADEIPFDIPKNWQWVRLGNIGETNIGLTYSPQNISADGTIVLRSGNIQNGKIDYSDIVKVNLKIPENKLCNKGDILICARNGSKKLVGKAAIIDKDKVTFGAFMAVFRSNFNPYILMVINSPYFHKMLAGDVGTMTINQITQDMLKNFLVPLPPLAEQKRIVAKLEELMPLIERLDAAEKKLVALDKAFPDQLRKSILQQAIQGKLSEQLPTDGNASDLLADIRAEKNKLIADGKIKKEKPLPPISADEIPFDIPKNWQWVRLGDIGFYKKGPFGSSLTKQIFVPKGNNAIKVYEQKNAIQKNSLLGDYYISKKYFDEKMKGFEVQAGDIIVSCAGTIGEAYIMPQDMEKGIINQALMRMKIFPPIFLKYFLLFFDFIIKKNANLNSKGSAIKNIPPLEKLKNFLFPLPPLAEQKRIVAKLEKILPLCDRLAEKLK